MVPLQFENENKRQDFQTYTDQELTLMQPLCIYIVQ